nr:hypothetical protein BaRGS_010312 [Batillaria attramentaria]
MQVVRLMVNIINISLATGKVPTCFMRAVVKLLIKKAGHDPSASAAAVANLESCSGAVKCWMSQNMLKLNDDKTEAILLGPRSRREKANIKVILVRDAKIPFAESVRDLGLTVDAEWCLT